MDEADRDAYLSGLTPGVAISHRATPFTEPLLQSLLQALHDPATGGPHLGNCRFDEAQFFGEAGFRNARFSGTARFHRAQFSGGAEFSGAQFSGEVGFNSAQFSGDAEFNRARFSGDVEFGGAQFFGEARFHGTQFSGEARFHATRFSNEAGFNVARFSGNAHFQRARFLRDAQFQRAQFSGNAGFAKAQFSSDARFHAAQFSGGAGFAEAQFSSGVWFRGARFAAMPLFGPLVCAGAVDLSRAVFEAPVTLEIAALEVHCQRTRWDSTATLRLRYATVDLSHAVLSFPMAVTAHPALFGHLRQGTVRESLLVGHQPGVRVVSVRGLDASHLMLTDSNLSDCLFSGAFHLDQLRLEGRCTFASTPTGLRFRHHIWPCRWSRRRALAEEHHWRAQSAGQPALPTGQTSAPRDWRTGPQHPDPDLTPDPESVAALYRQLRKAFEDGKNEPGAADFYYGEMEMRRHDRTGTPRAERGLLWAYWLLSGYGLRAARALGWLTLAMMATILLMMGLGLPDESPKQEAIGVVPSGGGRVTFEIDKEDPKNPTGDRFTTERFEKALNVTLNSVVFRSSGQDLTTTGTYIEMASRFSEPVLLGLAALAIRGRLKR
ncbi:pentapeptide repeat-containing protein [Streptomyces sp. NPDC001922]|uniref:pentapeptide repeat-containing protein n=1 Tax=Streptomyces sp. NPDC001922 TaxID=3364624 RepID=UPI0036A689F7